MGRSSSSEYLIFAIHDVCNARCRHCSLAALRPGLTPVSLDTFKRLLPERLARRRYSGVILSGMEVTLRDDLTEFARFAKSHERVRHIRIETNGMRLADPSYARALRDAGIDEFFVSVAGPTAAVHDDITQVPGSFDQTMAGLASLEQSDAVFSTNTVISARNCHHLDAVAHALTGYSQLREMHFWGLWPMGTEDTNDLIAKLAEVRTPLQEAIRIATRAGKRAVVKALPACVLGDCVAAFDNRLPDVIIDPSYFRVHKTNSFGHCLYRALCRVPSCRALSLAYVHKHGWEEDLLQPMDEGQLRAFGAAELMVRPDDGALG